MSDILFYDFHKSSAAYRLRIALALLGLEHRTHWLDVPGGEHKREPYLSIHPQGLVPAIVIDGIPMTQTVSVLEYLNETRDAGWLPDDAAGRQKVRALTDVIAMDIHPVCNSGVARWVEETSAGAISQQAWMERFIPRGLIPFERMLGEGRYSHGDRVTLADICLVPQLRNAELWGVDTSAFPRTVEIGRRLLELPAFRDTHPDVVGAQA